MFVCFSRQTQLDVLFVILTQCKEKFLLALQALKRGVDVDAQNPQLHTLIVRFFSTGELRVLMVASFFCRVRSGVEWAIFLFIFSFSCSGEEIAVSASGDRLDHSNGARRVP